MSAMLNNAAFHCIFPTSLVALCSQLSLPQHAAPITETACRVTGPSPPSGITVTLSAAL